MPADSAALDIARCWLTLLLTACTHGDPCTQSGVQVQLGDDVEVDAPEGHPTPTFIMRVTELFKDVKVCSVRVCVLSSSTQHATVAPAAVWDAACADACRCLELKSFLHALHTLHVCKAPPFTLLLV